MKANFLVVFLSQFLKGKGYDAEFISSYSVNRIRPLLEKKQYHCVIIEPDQFGDNIKAVIDLIKEVLPKAKIVAFSRLGYDENLMAVTKQAGLHGFVGKGLGPSELYSAVYRCGVKPGEEPAKGGGVMDINYW